MTKNFAVRTSDNAVSQRADELLSQLAAKSGERFRLRARSVRQRAIDANHNPNAGYGKILRNR